MEESSSSQEVDKVALKERFDKILEFNSDCTGMPIREAFYAGKWKKKEGDGEGFPTDARGCVRDGKRIFLEMSGMYGTAMDILISRPACCTVCARVVEKEEFYLKELIDVLKKWFMEASLPSTDLDKKVSAMHAKLDDGYFCMELGFQASHAASLGWEDREKREGVMFEITRGLNNFLAKTQMNDDQYKEYRKGLVANYSSREEVPESEWDIKHSSLCSVGVHSMEPLVDTRLSICYKQQDASAPQDMCDDILSMLLEGAMNRIEDLREAALKKKLNGGVAIDEKKHISVHVEKKRKLGLLM